MNAWPMARLTEAIWALAERQRMGPRRPRVEPLPVNASGLQPAVLAQFIESTAASIGVQADPRTVRYPDLDAFLLAGRAIVLRPDGTLLVLLPGHGRRVRLLGPDEQIEERTPDELRDLLCGAAEQPLRAAADRLVEAAGIPTSRRDRSLRAVFEMSLAATQIEGCWTLRRPPGESFAAQMREAGLLRLGVGFGLAHISFYALWVLSWALLGRAALDGRMAWSQMIAWAAVLLLLVPLHVAAGWLQSLFSVRFGALLKGRLLVGALRLDGGDVRGEGAGALLGRVLEAEALSSAGLSGTLWSAIAGVELLIACFVISSGAGGRWQMLLLVGWGLLALALGWRHVLRSAAWAASRIDLTRGLVERMAAHRTRAVQQRASRLHDGEDEDLETYHDVSSRMDQDAALLSAIIPRGWLLLGLFALVPAFIAGQASADSLAIGVGATLLAWQALQRLVMGLGQITRALLAWQQVAVPYAAAGRGPLEGVPGWAADTGDRMVVEARGVHFRHPGRLQEALGGFDLELTTGQRVLLEGRSGAGKSTLVSLLGGLRLPQSGLLLLGGLDIRTLGAVAWRRRIVVVPQFHENHVLTESFAFNLLLGRGWPAREEAFAEADAVCRELGLGPLIDRMPGGLMQVVGETGWQLSHGERSRLFVARALLQHPDLIILDESFAALDPETLAQCVECVRRRARTLLVVAHP